MNAQRAKPPTYRYPGAVLAMNVLLGFAAVGAVAALILEYGFRTPPVARGLLHAAEITIVGIFVLDRILRLVLARRRWAHLQDNWTDFALIFFALAGLVVGVRYYPGLLSAGALYVLISQVYLLTALILHAVSMNLRFAGSGIHPTWLLIGSFAFLCLAGSGLLMLPAATPPGTVIYYPDALFTAVSATCVTGLVVRDTGLDFTLFGQAVILVLIQLGGLGIMLFGTVLAMVVGKSLSFRSSAALGEMLSAEPLGRLTRAALFVVFITLAAEAIGAIGLYPMFAGAGGPDGRPLSTAGAVWFSIFHSVSGFCNAGFSLYGRNLMAGVGQASANLRDYWQIHGILAPLIVLGGLGFPVLQDCAGYVGRFVRYLLARRWTLLAPGRHGGRRPRLSLHSRVVLTSSAVLLIGGALLLIAVEPRPQGPKNVVGRHSFDGELRFERDWDSMGPSLRFREAVFQSVSARTAGFNTIDMSELSDAGKLSLCGLMIVGGSPASTAGGMKTVTVVLLLVTVYCVLRRRQEIEIFRRSIAASLLRRAVTLAVLYVALLVVVTMLLSVALRRESLIDVFFEACSACGTVGLSTGVTERLNLFAQSVIVAGMFIGRLGPLTLLLALTSRMRHVAYTYPEEHVVIG